MIKKSLNCAPKYFIQGQFGMRFEITSKEMNYATAKSYRDSNRKLHLVQNQLNVARDVE